MINMDAEDDEDSS